MDKNIIITVEGGCLVDVTGLPEGYTYSLVDLDDECEHNFQWQGHTNEKGERIEECIHEDCYADRDHNGVIIK